MNIDDIYKRWLSLFTSKTTAGEIWSELDTKYTQSERGYHNWKHVAECLQETDAYPFTMHLPRAVELCFWFHDLIYTPGHHDNEEKSAAAAGAYLKRLEEPQETIETVHRNILSTDHSVMIERGSLSGDQALIHDIDLWILSAPPARLMEWEDGIRREFAYLPFGVYRAKRRMVLELFLRRDHIYFTDYYQQRNEEKARSNLSRLIEHLDQQ